MDSRIVTPVSEEFIGAELGDKRLTRRLLGMADSAEQAPGASLPQRAGSSAELEATYRFFANKRVPHSPIPLTGKNNPSLLEKTQR